MKAKELNIKVIKVPVELSSRASSKFEREINECIECNPAAIYLDCQELEHVTSSHIGLLIKVYQSCAIEDIKIQLESPTNDLVLVLKVLDLFEYFASDADADSESQSFQPKKMLSRIFADAFTASSDNISEGLNEFMDFLSPMELPQMLKFELKTIFYEITANIRIHSQVGEKESIVFTAKTDKNKIVMVFADSGIPFDMASKNWEIDPIIAGKNRQRNGYGIAIINKLADKIHYVRENNVINVLIVEKSWGVMNE